jgi:DNA-binding SARP family transcriptional activator
MYFAILGPLEVRNATAPLTIGGAKRRALLIALLANANKIVPIDQLMFWLWPKGAPPRSAALVIQAHISSLRQQLEPDRPPRSEPRLLLTTSAGYLIDVGTQEFDVFQFEALLSEGARWLQRDDPELAAETLRQALDLWRGSALCDVRDLQAARAEVARLEELQLTAWTRYIESGLRLGRHLEVVPHLTVLVSDFPYHEGFYAQLMTALAGCGRRAEALAVYQKARRLLAEELGVEPGPELRAVEASILHGSA